MPKTWKWTAAKEQAAQLLAQGDLRTHEISSKVGISESTLFSWKRVPDFQKRVEENLEQVKLEIAQQAAIEYRYRTTWHEGALDKILKVVGSLSFQDFNPMRRSPTSLINLAIRLQRFAQESERAKNNLTPTEWEAEQMRIINGWHCIFDDDKDLDPAERAEFLAGFERFYEAHPNCRPQPPTNQPAPTQTAALPSPFEN
jgi:transposase-like protein